jgi:hypothetical protein
MIQLLSQQHQNSNTTYRFPATNGLQRETVQEKSKWYTFRSSINNIFHAFTLREVHISTTVFKLLQTFQ